MKRGEKRIERGKRKGTTPRFLRSLYIFNFLTNSKETYLKLTFCQSGNKNIDGSERGGR